MRGAETRRRRGRDADLSEEPRRGDAAAATRAVRGDDDADLSKEPSRGAAARIEDAAARLRYYAPAYAGDTFRKKFVLRAKRVPRERRSVLALFECELRNQRDELVFSVDKHMLFPLSEGEAATRYESPSEHADYVYENHKLRQQIVSHADRLGHLGGVTLRSLEPGALVLHGAARQSSRAKLDAARPRMMS